MKAVDFELSSEAGRIADALIAETLSDPGVVEIGYRGGDRWTVGPRDRRPVSEHTRERERDDRDEGPTCEDGRATHRDQNIAARFDSVSGGAVVTDARY